MDEARREKRERLLARMRTVGLGRIQALNAALLALQQNAGDGVAGEEIVREIHTLKGETKLVGFAEISNFAHAIEALLFSARDAGWKLARNDVRRLLTGFDLLEQALKDPAGALPEGAAAWRGEPVPASSERTAEPAPAVADSAAASPDAIARFMRRRSGDFLSVRLPVVDRITELVGEIGEGMASTQRVVAKLRRGSTSLEAGLIRLASGDDDPKERLLGLRSELREIEAMLEQSREAAFLQGLRVQELEQHLRELRLVPISTLTEPLPRAVHDLAVDLQKDVQLSVSGAEVGADRRVVDQLAEPLLHLVRNALDHGIEPAEVRLAAGKPRVGTLSIRAAQLGGRLILSIADDGAGIDPARLREAAMLRGLLSTDAAGRMTDADLLQMIFEAGFTTRKEVGEISGRGVGLDVVKARIESIGGSVRVESGLGSGTEFVLEAPLSISLVDSLLATVGTAVAALPSSSVRALVDLEIDHPERSGGGYVLRFREQPVPLVSLAELLGVPAPGRDEGGVGLVLAHGRELLAVRVDGVLGHRAVVQRDADPLLAGIRILGGTAVIGEGRAALAINVPELIARARGSSAIGAEAAAASRKRSVLIVEDSEILRVVVAEIFRSEGFSVAEAEDGRAALRQLERARPDVMTVDLEMPGMDGYSLLAALRADPHLRTIPAVVFSTLAAAEVQRRCRELGAAAFVAKEKDNESELVRTALRLAGGRGV